MNKKTLPFDYKKLKKITEEYPTPFHIYDEKAIRENARRFKKAFEWVPTGFENYFAVKALPNPYILKILKEEGMGADCSSIPELMLSEKVGLSGEDIMFTSNDTPLSEFEYAKKLGAIINLDDISHIPFLEKIGLPEVISCRFNPGPLKHGNDFIGNPVEAKYGFTLEQLIEGFTYLKKAGVQRFGLHTMVASNELDPDYFIETATVLFQAMAEISDKVGIHFDFLNFGGGIGIPYEPDQNAVNIEKISTGLKKLYSTYVIVNALKPPKIMMECGRVITGPYGYLVSKVLHKKKTYKKYIGLDSCMADLMRPGLYGAYHHITVPGKENETKRVKYDVTGSLCENNDKFAINRELPPLEVDDLVVIHDTGAHGYAMGFNYNGKLKHAELLLKENGSVEQIRRAETIDDYFATLDFSGLK